MNYEVSTYRNVVDSYGMNTILKNNDIKDDDKVKLVDLWTDYNRVKAELKNLTRLIKAINVLD